MKWRHRVNNANEMQKEMGATGQPRSTLLGIEPRASHSATELSSQPLVNILSLQFALL